MLKWKHFDFSGFEKLKSQTKHQKLTQKKIEAIL